MSSIDQMRDQIQFAQKQSGSTFVVVSSVEEARHLFSDRPALVEYCEEFLTPDVANGALKGVVVVVRFYKDRGQQRFELKKGVTLAGVVQANALHRDISMSSSTSAPAGLE